jgi:ornithine cyclodeaminase/alanine dehydrogenase-like protein (mu-crystallin family)
MIGPYRSSQEIIAALRAADVRAHLKTVMERHEAGLVQIAPRGAIGLKSDGSVTHVMTARDHEQGLVVSKVVDYDPGRPRRDGRATAAGVVSLLCDGRPLLICPADEFTGIRTGSCSAFAIDGLVTPGPLRVALAGPGLVGSETIGALRRFRALTWVRIVGGTEGRARQATALAAELEIPVDLCRSVGEATDDADVLITATSAVEPLVDASDLPASVRVIAALGAGIAERRELTAAAVASCDTVVVDTLEGAVTEAGDLVQARAEGVCIDPLALGVAIAAAPIAGRILYKSVGSAWQDLACLLAVLDVIDPGWSDCVGTSMELG